MKNETILKSMHDINTFMATADNETHLIGRDEHGKEFHIVFRTIELLEWLDHSYMKERSIEYIRNLNAETLSDAITKSQNA